LTSIHGGEKNIDVNGLRFILGKNKKIVADIIEETTDAMETTLEESTF
jgi:hypothetical protein